MACAPESSKPCIVSKMKVKGLTSLIWGMSRKTTWRLGYGFSTVSGGLLGLLHSDGIQRPGGARWVEFREASVFLWELAWGLRGWHAARRRLQVAYLAGRFSPAAYHGEEGGEQPIGVQRRSDVERLVDQVLLDPRNTNEWPQAVLQGADHSGLPPGINPRSVGSPIAAEIAKEVNPRQAIFSWIRPAHPFPLPLLPLLPLLLLLLRLPFPRSPPSHTLRHVSSPQRRPSGGPDRELLVFILLPVTILRADISVVAPSAVATWLSARGRGGRMRRAYRLEASPPIRRYAPAVHTTSRNPYHVAGTEGAFFAREPYSNPQAPHVTRFIALAAVGNEAKQKFIHALSPTPASQMAPPDLAARPPNTTPSPYGPPPPPPGETRLWHGSAGGAGGAEGAAGVGGDAAKPKPAWASKIESEGQDGQYWRPEVEAHLVISVAEHCYVALCKGPLVPGHVLVLPIEHFPSSISMPADVLAEMARYKDALRRCFASQVVPLPKEAAGGVRAGFESAAQKFGFDFEAIAPGLEASAMVDEVRRVSKGGNYLCVELPEGGALMHAVAPGERLPMQFGREVAAELLKMPERGDWKACKVSVEEETKIVEDFKALFLDFDIM
eukprot:jgi/Mesen1/9931/ME000070S09221